MVQLTCLEHLPWGPQHQSLCITCMYPETCSDTTTDSPWFEQQLEKEKRKSVVSPSKLFAVDAHLAGSNISLSLRLPSQHLVLSKKRETVSIQCLVWTCKYFFCIPIHGPVILNYGSSNRDKFVVIEKLFYQNFTRTCMCSSAFTDSDQEGQLVSDPPDPDPEHWRV
jgi:hypothetical protein